MPEPAPLDPEDAKLVVLARSARARVGATEGAAVRDETGRTYAAATVALPSLRLDALQAAVAAAVASGAASLEAAAVVGGSAYPGVPPVLADLRCPRLLDAAPDGSLRAVLEVPEPVPEGSSET
jgi:hypothetical protein